MEKYEKSSLTSSTLLLQDQVINFLIVIDDLPIHGRCITNMLFEGKVNKIYLPG